MGDNAAAFSVENDDYLQNRLKAATAEDAGQLLVEFLKEFCLDKSEAAVVDGRPRVEP